MDPDLDWASTIKLVTSATDVSRRVVVIASGSTEQRALPHLVKHLASAGVDVQDVRTPPGHRAINVANAEKVIRSVWYERVATERPDKFVVLLDTDASPPTKVLGPILPLRSRLHKASITASVQFAYAQRHLEAWYFADPHGLANYLDRPLGKAGATAPDKLVNPKKTLKDLLGPRLYTARVSECIAAQLDVKAITGNSPSFRVFIAAVKNGDECTCVT